MITKHNNFIKKGFTLAEVLITLGIIGVIAALTIPTLINNIQTEQFRTGLKKSYTTLSQAVSTIQAQNSDLDVSSTDNLITDLGTQIKILQKGTWGSLTSLPATFNYKCYKEPNGTCGDLIKRPSMDGWKAFITSDGVLFMINSVVYPNCDCVNWHAKINSSDASGLNNVCASFFVDVNADKGPNQIGMDMHFIYLIKQNNNYYVRPAGANINNTCSAGYPDDYNRSLHCTNRMLLNMDMP